MATLSANSHCGSPWFKRTPSLKNLMFLNLKISLLLLPDWRTFKYSQERIVQNKAPMPNCPVAFSVSVRFLLYIMTSTRTGRAFCCFELGSLLRKARKSLDKILPRSPSSSFVGFSTSIQIVICQSQSKESKTGWAR